jgi:hypothetical protein
LSFRAKGEITPETLQRIVYMSADFDCDEWIKIHPYNIVCSYRNVLEKNSGGMIYFVATDFNPLNAQRNLRKQNRESL